jgi:predicted amidophosphoribosyltransferase
VYLDAMYYFDFYAIERFGKTRLGTLLHHAKQGQNRKLILEVVEIIKKPLYELITREKIEAVGFIPPTIQRNIQFMKVMEKGLNLSLPHLSLKKISGEYIVPQKALSKIEDRISNAQVSLMVNERGRYNRVLLIDDALGSGATINETAGKLKFKGVAKWIAGIAVTGSYKGFEVIQEV